MNLNKLKGWRTLKTTADKKYRKDYAAMLILICLIAEVGALTTMVANSLFLKDIDIVLLCLLASLFPVVISYVFLYLIKHPRSVHAKNKQLAFVSALLALPTLTVLPVVGLIDNRYGVAIWIVSVVYTLLAIYLTWPWVHSRKRQVQQLPKQKQ